MTKNRKTKQATRAAANAAGVNYTTALRDTDVTAHPQTTEPGRDPFRIPFGADPSVGSPTYVNLGGPNDPPVTVVGGYTGSGKTVVVNQLAHVFLDHNPNGRILWLDPKGSGPTYWPLNKDRTQVYLNLNEPDVAAAVRATVDEPTGDPTLVIVEDALHLGDLVGADSETTQSYRDALTALARGGRSTGVRLLLTSQVPVPAEEAYGTVGTRIWVAHGRPDTVSQFFTLEGSSAVSVQENLPWGHGWISVNGADPQRIEFPAPTFAR